MSKFVPWGFGRTSARRDWGASTRGGDTWLLLGGRGTEGQRPFRRRHHAVAFAWVFGISEQGYRPRTKALEAWAARMERLSPQLALEENSAG